MANEGTATSTQKLRIRANMNMIEKSVETMLRVEALGKTVPNGSTGLTILSGVSFEVHAAEAVAIVGVSGSGKSTLLGLLAGLDTPTHDACTSMVTIFSR